MKDEITIEKRERIFRVWDNFQRKMMGEEYDGTSIGLLPARDKTGISVYCSNGDIALVNVLYENCDIMEFIGSRDKNKKNIYELDIIKWREQLGDNSDESDLIIRNDHILGLIVWNQAFCGFTVEQLTKGKWINKIDGCVFEYDTGFYSIEGQSFHWEDVEIVGNKYENSDIYEQLLEMRNKENEN